MGATQQLLSSFGAAFSPADLAGKAFWYDASILSDANGTALASWPDSFGNGYTATAAGGARPTVVAPGLNGLRTLAFNGSSNVMVNTFNVVQPVTFFIVGKINTNAVSFTRFIGGGPTGGLVIIGQQGTQGPDVNLLIYAGGFWDDANTFPPDTFVVLTCIVDGASTQGYLNGSLITPSGGNNAGSGGTTGLSIGANQGSEFLVGEVAEMIACTTTPSGPQIAQVNTYLADKWGI